MKRFKETIYISVLVSMAAQIKLDFFVDGFIVALSVVIFVTFLYFYENLSPLYIAILSGIFSPLFRMITLMITGRPAWQTFLEVIPDSSFFITFGCLYYIIYHRSGLLEKSRNNFPFVIVICDVISNSTELCFRSILTAEMLITPTVFKSLIIIAVIRTIIIQLLVLLLEAYRSLLLRQDHDEKYRKLVVLASIFESELYIMNKSALEIEDITQKAYHLYKSMESLDIPADEKKIALEISKNAHEIKSDYVRTIKALRDNFVNEYSLAEMHIRDIIYILKNDIDHQLAVGHQKIDFVTTVKGDFTVSRHFDMMSILRNLVINSIEAIGDRKGLVKLTITCCEDKWLLTIRDNGPGIKQENLDYVFSHGFTTKFDEQTGDLSRGVGLTIVKSYVEEIFNGKIWINTEIGAFTAFNAEFPLEAQV